MDKGDGIHDYILVDGHRISLNRHLTEEMDQEAGFTQVLLFAICLMTLGKSFNLHGSHL